MDRRSFLRLATMVATGASCGFTHHPNSIHFTLDPLLGMIPELGWDTEGTHRAGVNLLRSQPGLSLLITVKGKQIPGTSLPVTRVPLSDGGTQLRFAAGFGVEVIWEIRQGSGPLQFTIYGRGAAVNQLGDIEILFPFDPSVTPTTVLPAGWDSSGMLQLPAVIHAPDFGQMLLSDRAHPRLQGRLNGSRDSKTVDFTLELPQIAIGEIYNLSFTPVVLPPPEGLVDKKVWPKIRRAWFNSWQPAAEWGDQTQAFSAPAGILANNVISDAVSFALPHYADRAFWTPVIAPGISMMNLVRRTIDWWLDNRTLPTGEVVGYWDINNFLDSNPGILISAWDYVDTTGDTSWLMSRITELEKLSEFLESRDIDSDGMVEATQSGNYGTLFLPNRSCNWLDAINCGYKDGYSNAIIYRAWRCMADLEAKLSRRSQQARYSDFADRLKAVYSKTLLNPATNWLAMWKSQDGTLHDYVSPTVNGIAIEYGLIDQTEGREILTRLWQTLAKVGYTRLDLGIPSSLIPILKADYIQGGGFSEPQKDDGSDTFQQYENGGVFPGLTAHFLAAHFVVGVPEKADAVLNAMIDRQNTVGFQNGVRNQYPLGIDWTTWDGEPCGYEGYLVDNYAFLQLALLREASLRARYYRPLRPE